MKTIYILIFFISLIIILLSIFLMLLFNNKNIKKELILIKEKTDKQREIPITTALKRIAIIAQSNQSVNKIFKQVNLIYKNFLLKLKIIKNLIWRLEKETNSFKFFSKKNKLLYLKVKSESMSLDKIENEFNSLSFQVLNQDQILRTEFNFYQKILRKVFDFYEEKKIFFDKFINKIENFKESIKYIEKEFEKIVDNGNVKKGFILIQRYIQKIVIFSNLINNGPSLIVKINIQIPHFVDNLNKLYLKQKKEFGTASFQNIKFYDQLKKIARKFDYAKKSLSNLEIKKTIIKTKDVLIKLQKLEDEILSEIKAKNKFIKVHQIVIAEAKKTLQKWALIDKQFKKIVGSGKTVESIIFENYNQIKDIINNFYKKLSNYQNNTIIDSNTSYINKISQTKELVIITKEIIYQINNFIDIIWEIDLNSINLKNKFFRAENIVHQIVATAKKRNIILLLNEKKIINELLRKKLILAKKIKMKINYQIKDEIEKFSENTKNLYIFILSKIEMAFHIKNIIKELSLKRAINNKLNLGLKQVEKKYLEGKYTSGFNEVIEWFKNANSQLKV